MQKRITITRPLATHILTLAQQTPGQEICGLVSADNHGKPCTVYPISNVADSPDTRFEMNPDEQLAAFKSMREKQETLFAIYHSHPNAAAEPSQLDIENLAYPEAYQLIISLSIKGVLEMRAFQQDKSGQLTEVQLTV